MANGQPTILLVDDEFATLEVLSLLLEAAGYAVVGAVDGEQASEKLGTYDIGLVVTDYMMPKLNGLELARRMESDPATAAIPIVIVSGVYRGTPAPPARVVATFAKPLDFYAFLDFVRTVLPPEP